jgi:putative N6-adenine-specific DNA methylase
VSALEHFFATCPRGLEEALVDELAEIGIPGASASAGGIEFTATLVGAYRVNLHSRLASRILMRLARAPYASEEDVYQLALAQPWGEWFSPDQTLRVDVTATKSPLKSLEFATLRVKDGIVDRMRRDTQKRPSIDTRTPDVRVFCYLSASECTLYLDTSGDALFKRGWRTAAGEAPVRENLAAGILRLAGWHPGQRLIDPMCGSGTFIVEAAQTILGIAPGAMRHFGFEKLRNFAADDWSEVRSVMAQPKNGLELLSASDVSGDAVVLARGNLERAGVSGSQALAIAAKQIDARQIRPSGDSGTLVLNPPYGERVTLRNSESDDAFFAEFGNTLKQRFAGWGCYVLTSDMELQRKMRLAPKRRTPLFNGAIECRLYRFDLVAGRPQ